MYNVIPELAKHFEYAMFYSRCPQYLLYVGSLLNGDYLTNMEVPINVGFPINTMRFHLHVGCLSYMTQLTESSPQYSN